MPSRYEAGVKVVAGGPLFTMEHEQFPDVDHTVFVGIEMPNEDSLAECSKSHNKGRDLVESVKRLQRAGLQCWVASSSVLITIHP